MKVNVVVVGSGAYRVTRRDYVNITLGIAMLFLEEDPLLLL